ncbi:MAG: hypothetical protein EP326_10325 [Deltaproteobacteria bacterium]|nr:MAG: hypothetical protein EP326_10325 [Deltaproteobacteria bacterium]TNF29268.1 MAG: hypothetical protein EP319_07365 [Deltaproteobacteria bacterium]
MKFLMTALMLISTTAMANLHQAPPTLNINRSTKGVFVDFTKVKSEITYNVKMRTAKVVTTIEFIQAEEGSPVFDLVPTPTSVSVNGKNVKTEEASLDGVSTVRYVKETLPKGTYNLVILNEIEKNISFESDHVKSAFWMSDLSDRRYLEQYLPTNLEYDQYKNDIEVRILGTDEEHVLYTNGEVTELSKNYWSVSYPEVYTASSLFFHLTKKGLIPEKKADYKSIDGRTIPVTVYTSQSTQRFMDKALEVLAELERDYGPFPHNQVIIYGAGSGGMEYCGATITSFSALGHELTHSYFARGIMPAHGNAGWVDEAIASWRDSGYPSYTEWRLSRTSMAGHSVYRRTTDRAAYSSGMKFIGHLHEKFKAQESFKVFLKRFFEERKFKPFKTPEFKKAIEDYYNTDVTALFNKYVYGTELSGAPSMDENHKGHEHKENEYHPRLSEQQLLELL